MSKHESDAEWRDPANWRGGPLRLYVAPRDPRLLVPARRRWLGWTLNLGRRETWIAVALLFALMLVALWLIIRHFGAPLAPGRPRV